MSRTAYLRLPFFDPKHRAFADEIDQWAGDTAADIGHGDDIDATCVRWVQALGAAGWLQYCVPAACGHIRTHALQQNAY
jgi:acyl-CoA dehydrogenase